MKKYYLSSTDRKLCGVCGGIAEYFNIDSFLVRMVVFCMLLSGVGFLAYFAMAILAPKAPDMIDY